MCYTQLSYDDTCRGDKETCTITKPEEPKEDVESRSFRHSRESGNPVGKYGKYIVIVVVAGVPTLFLLNRFIGNKNAANDNHDVVDVYGEIEDADDLSDFDEETGTCYCFLDSIPFSNFGGEGFVSPFNQSSPRTNSEQKCKNYCCDFKNIHFYNFSPITGYEDINSDMKWCQRKGMRRERERLVGPDWQTEEVIQISRELLLIIQTSLISSLD